MIGVGVFAQSRRGVPTYTGQAQLRKAFGQAWNSTLRVSDVSLPQFIHDQSAYTVHRDDGTFRHLSNKSASFTAACHPSLKGLRRLEQRLDSYRLELSNKLRSKSWSTISDTSAESPRTWARFILAWLVLAFGLRIDQYSSLHNTMTSKDS